jgi:hypothetical protein
MTGKSKKRCDGLVDRIIVIAIAVCIVAMINVANSKINEIYDAHKSSLMMNDVSDTGVSEVLSDQIEMYRPGTCKMIEVYNGDLTLLFRIQFNEDNITEYGDLNDYPELKELLQNHKEGSTTITTDDEEEDIYFRWTKTDTGEDRLAIIYMTTKIVKNVWVISFLGYIVLILVFILLIRMRLHSHSSSIKRYQELSEEVHSKLLH